MAHQHCDIFKARDEQYYCRIETAAFSEQFELYGPFITASSSLDYLQKAHGIENEFYLEGIG